MATTIERTGKPVYRCMREEDGKPFEYSRGDGTRMMDYVEQLCGAGVDAWVERVCDCCGTDADRCGCQADLCLGCDRCDNHCCCGVPNLIEDRLEELYD